MKKVRRFVKWIVYYLLLTKIRWVFGVELIALFGVVSCGTRLVTLAVLCIIFSVILLNLLYPKGEKKSEVVSGRSRTVVFWAPSGVVRVSDEFSSLVFSLEATMLVGSKDWSDIFSEITFWVVGGADDVRLRWNLYRMSEYGLVVVSEKHWMSYNPRAEKNGVFRVLFLRHMDPLHRVLIKA